ncbi:MAG: hypothetical protein AAGJ09_16140 [Pseudomonadota bacterium]
MKPGSTFGALIGSFELAQFDAEALKRFDLSSAGFWQSFTAVLFLIPIFMLGVYLQNIYFLRQGSTPEPYDIAILVILLDWVLFVLLMRPITGLLGVKENYFGAMTVYNWCRPLAFAFYIPVLAAGAAGLAGSNTLFLLYYLAVTLRSVYQGYILHLTLRLSLWAIFAMIVLDIILGEFIIVVLRQFFL